MTLITGNMESEGLFDGSLQTVHDEAQVRMLRAFPERCRGELLFDLTNPESGLEFCRLCSVANCILGFDSLGTHRGNL